MVENVIICEVCLRIAGYNNSDIIDGAIIGKPEIISSLQLKQCNRNRLLVANYYFITFHRQELDCL